LSEEQRIVVIGASAGGVSALIHLARNLPGDFPAPIMVVLHVPAQSPSLLALILNREGMLPAKSAEDGERYEAGRIYVATPDRHLLVGRDGRLRVTRGPRENRHRPSVDPLFRSAALAAGPRAIAVVLTGALDDGTAGMLAINQAGGIGVAQDPEDALYPSMPSSAITHARIDHVAPLAAIPELLVRLVSEPAGKRPVVEQDLALETRIAALDPAALVGDDRPGQPSPYSCPECGGVLWEIQDGAFARYRCRVGHAYSPETMLGAQDDVLEEALWSAMKTLEESARLSQRLAKNERERGREWMAKRFEEKEADARERVEVIRRHLLRDDDANVPLDIVDTPAV
jgi:two-component system chemotaxis response regulator CheB